MGHSKDWGGNPLAHLTYSCTLLKAHRLGVAAKVELCVCMGFVSAHTVHGVYLCVISVKSEK